MTDIIDDEIDLSSLSDEELTLQMHDDLYDGMLDEICEGTNILLGRGWGPKRVLDEFVVRQCAKVDFVFVCVGHVSRVLLLVASEQSEIAHVFSGLSRPICASENNSQESHLVSLPHVRSERAFPHLPKQPDYYDH
jgi:hypothetical protein